MRCADGWADLRTLRSVATDRFQLRVQKFVEMVTVRSGMIPAGLVTLTSTSPSGTSIGRWIPWFNV